MVHLLSFTLFKLKVTQPSENTIYLWMQNEDVDKLEYALQHGNYKTRRLAAEALGHVGRPSSIPILRHAINDKIHNVSIAALNTLDALGCKGELCFTIIRKRFNWLKDISDKQQKREVNKDKKYTIYRWERASKKSFERVKEQLKRPMR